MTGAQASYLKTLCEQAHSPEVFNDDLTKAAAVNRRGVPKPIGTLSH